MDQGSAGPGVAQNDQLGAFIRSENIARLVLNLRRDAGPARTWDGSSAVVGVPGPGPAAGSAGFLGVPASARGGTAAPQRWGERATWQEPPCNASRDWTRNCWSWAPSSCLIGMSGVSSGVDQNGPVDPLLQPRAYPL